MSSTVPQAREYDAPVRIADRDYVCRESSGGVAFANTIIRSFFGYRPVLDGGMALFAEETPRGFTGKLRHVRQQNKLYTITSSANGLHFEVERPPLVKQAPSKRNP